MANRLNLLPPNLRNVRDGLDFLNGLNDWNPESTVEKTSRHERGAIKAASRSLRQIQLRKPG
jgi:hypothetical protein